MKAEDFQRWAHEMIESGSSKNMTSLAKVLGVDRATLYALMRRGGNVRDDLACAAIIHGIKPYSEK